MMKSFIMSTLHRVLSRGAIPPPQYAFMAWCSVKESPGTTLILPPNVIWVIKSTGMSWAGHVVRMKR
jgi:hypothetical protein